MEIELRNRTEFIFRFLFSLATALLGLFNLLANSPSACAEDTPSQSPLLKPAFTASANELLALAEDGDFESRVTAFCDAYREHITLEEKELLSLARHILSHRQLEELGKAMARRRGLRR